MLRILLCYFLSFLGTTLFSQISNLDNFIANELSLENIPGLAACVVKNGKVVWQGTYGFTNMEDQIPVDTSTLFTLASISKLFVGTAIIQLQEAGQLTLDDPINDYLNFEITNPFFPDQEITFRQLLQHRSSLKDAESLLYDFWQAGDSPIQLANYIEDHLSIDGIDFNPSIFNNNVGPGQATWYSNFGFGLLGYLVEVISEVPYHEYIQTNILDPLCMDNTSFFFEDIDLQNYAIPHEAIGNTNNSLGTYGIPNYPAALLKSNIQELSHFLMAYTQRGTIEGFSLFSSESADLLTPLDFSASNLAWWNGTTWTYTAYAPNEEVWFHGGYMPGIRTRINYYPQDSSGIIILTNGEGQYRWIEDTLQQYIPAFNLDDNYSFPCTITAHQTPFLATSFDTVIFPNPTNHQVTLSTKMKGKKSLNIYDISGNMVYNGSFNDKKNHTFDVTNWPRGFYLFTLNNEFQRFDFGKLIVD